MHMCCPDCGGNVWRSETMHRPGRDGRMLTTHTFVCDCCAVQQDKALYARSPAEIDQIIARERNNESIVAKNSQDMKAIADLQRQLEAERAAHAASKLCAFQAQEMAKEITERFDAERADHEATKKWLRRARNLLDGLVK